MKNNHRSERGQAIVLITVAIVGLVAMTGLAIDGGFAFSDRRHAQNAADTAALAGALKKTRAPQTAEIIALQTAGWSEENIENYINDLATLAALNLALENDFTNDAANNTVTVNIPPTEPGPYQGNNEYVEVVIESFRETYFAKVIGVDRMNNRVSAVAKAKYLVDEPFGGGNTFVSLQPHDTGNCSGDFVFSGDVEIILDGGGIFVNSADLDCALVQNGSCSAESPITTPDGSLVPIAVVGDIGPTVCTEQLDATFDTNPDPIVWPDDIFRLPPPAECEETSYPVPQNNLDGTWTVFPGKYSVLPPSIQGVQKNIILAPGDYCVESVIKTATLESLTGEGVFIYIESGGSFSLTGGDITLIAREHPVPPPENYIPRDHPYVGFLLYVDPPTPMPIPPTTQPLPDNCSVGGNGFNTFQGTIYTPYCNLNIGGTSNPSGFQAQFIGYTVELTGTANLYFEYDENLIGASITPAEVGLSQ